MEAMETSPKQIAQDFLKLCVKGEARKAFGLYTAPNFRHHNVYFKGDAESLIVAMENNAKQMPNKAFEIQRVLGDGDLVATHSHVRPRPEDFGSAVVHIFRFEDGKIAELWDMSQAVPVTSPNKNGMF